MQTGAADGPHVHAALTVTFGGLKPVHALGDCGRVELVDIGLDLPPTDMVGFEAHDVRARWPIPGPKDDKYTQGVTGVLAGSATYPGAAILCTGAAVAATSGMVRYAGSAAAEVVSHWPEVVAAPSASAAGRVQAWAVGPGLGTDDAAAAALWFALSTDLPVLVDADGLTMLAAHPDLVAGRSAPTVLTPHAGEFARLAGSRPVTTASPPPAGWPTASAPPCCSRATSRSSPNPADRSTSTPPANRGPPPPDPVTCCPA